MSQTLAVTTAPERSSARKTAPATGSSGRWTSLTSGANSRVLQTENAGVLWILFFLTGSMVPVITSQTIAQDVTVRDPLGFLLATESYQARFVTYLGLGAWGVNAALNLTVRSRKCLSRLQITTIGELVSKSADELLTVRNFGVTSLNEIRQKLGDIAMSLRNE